MFLNYLLKLADKSIPRWVILMADILISFFSFIFAFELQRNFWFDSKTIDEIFYPLIIVLLFRTQAFIITRSYTGVIKYTSTEDAIRIFTAVAMSTVAIWATGLLYHNFTGKIFIKLSVIVLDTCLVMIMLTALRLGIKVIYREIVTSKNSIKKKVIIYGAGHTGLLAKRTLENDSSYDVKVVAFLDDNPKLEGKSAEGSPIFGVDNKFHETIHKFKPKELIVAIPTLSAANKKKIIEKCLEQKLIVKTVPPVDNWINGELSLKQIRNVNIEELLERDEIILDKDNINNALRGKSILITGAAGSIGSEITRQCLPFSPKLLILVDQAESPLHELIYDLDEKKFIRSIVADVRNENRMRGIFDKYKPDVVFHAAAYKHVPLMEDNPYEAIHTNVFGTQILANLAVEFDVEKFVYISTDKAVNPTNIMGASKRIGEIYIQSLNAKLDLSKHHHTKFITTRFGNVLGSNGSVIPRFTRQIEEGGPLTVTHPEITRYFMTIPEACQLVLEAAVMGRGGEIYIFDMGEPVKIVDLACKMIRLSGFEPYEDIDIIFTGLRPGEKLREELLNDKENTIGTHHAKIMVVKVRDYNFLEVTELIEAMSEAAQNSHTRVLVSIMKQIVPEYISNNSVYEELDRKLTR